MSCPLLPRLSVLPVRAELARQHRTQVDLAVTAGYTRNTVSTFFAAGDLTWGQADRLAAALGVHPNDLWGAQWWAIEEAHADAVRVRERRKRERGRERRRQRSEEDRAHREWVWRRGLQYLDAGDWAVA